MAFGNMADLLAPITFFGAVRAAIACAIVFFLPGYLLLCIVSREKPLAALFRRPRKREAFVPAPLFGGFLETVLASVVLSIIVSAFVFTLLAFSVGLSAFSALAAICIVILVEAVFVWKNAR